ncbi:MAG: S1 RNA-binding domain-containing protein [Paludibacteraceae bacterium]|nr:S1 RNA-binding domain-containing protein [Paludibacteraceae bacterium]
MSKIKTVPNGKEWCPNDDFDWSLYVNGYNGGSNLVPNKRVKTKPGDVCCCHEPYAQELYDRMGAYFEGRKFTPKDSREGAMYSIDGIEKLSDHEVIINSNNGMSSVVDLNKEQQFIHSLGMANTKEFLYAITEHPEFKAELLKSDLCAKVVENNRVSIWDGYQAKIEQGFFEDLRRKEGPRWGYKAKVLSVNNGGYTVDIMGVNCFLPNSLAASGPVTDANALIGKEVMVCVVNYSQQTKNFVVSHKKYLEITLPSRIDDELYVGKDVFVKVTGITKNGLFCAIRDKNGDYVFASLMHRSTMSSDAEASFDKKEFLVGDMFKAFVHKINWVNDKECRIVIGDKEPVTGKEELENGKPES